MIDRFDLRVPDRPRPFTYELERLIGDAGDEMWQKSRSWERIGDLRQFGIPAIAHIGCKLSKTPFHKLQVLEGGKKRFGEVVEIGKRVFRGEPEEWEVMRSDLTADIPDVPVQWFREHVYFACKRTVREFGYIPAEVPVKSVRSSRAQTLYGGVAPNQTRIYDKVGETLHRYKKMERQFAHRSKVSGIEYVMPDFQTFSGFGLGSVLTRVERACVGRDLDKLGITTLESLRNADRLHPFTHVRFFSESVEPLRRQDWDWKTWYIGEGLKADIEAYGLDNAREMMRARLKSNLPRWWNKLQPFIRAACADYRQHGISSAQLQASYEDSTRYQMAA